MARVVEPLSEEEMEAWLRQAATRKFLQYLRDFRLSLMETWATGQLLPEAWPEAQAKADLLQQLSEADFEMIDEFYRPASETPADG